MGAKIEKEIVRSLFFIVKCNKEMIEIIDHLTDPIYFLTKISGISSV